jgi:hypothetical protein
MEATLRKQIHLHLSHCELQLALLREFFACNPRPRSQRPTTERAGVKETTRRSGHE